MSLIARIERALAGSAPPDDPLAVAAELERYGLSGDALAAHAAALRPAAVLVPLLESAAGEALVLTRRAEHLRHHRGQVSFPGGGMEPADADLAATALREASEEIGLAPADVDVIGYLPTQPTITGFAVTPVVARVAAPLEYRIDAGEVAEAFEVPLAFLFDELNRRPTDRLVNGIRIRGYEWQFERRRIWGATAQMLERLIDIAK